MKVTNKIYKILPTDKDYSKLEIGVGGNRQIDRTMVEKLKTSMPEVNVLPLAPIIVHKNVIIDGQHRYIAALELGLPIYVMFNKEKMDYRMLGKLNSNQCNWRLRDFAEYWATKNGTKKTYRKYLEYIKDNQITHGMLITIYQGRSVREGNNKAFKDGKLVFSPHIQNHVEDRLYKLRKLNVAAANPALEKRTLVKQQFQSAILVALDKPNFKFNKFLKNLYHTTNSFNKLAKRVDMEEEIYRIETIK